MDKADLRTLSAELAAGDEIGFYGQDDDQADAPSIMLRRRLGQLEARRRSGEVFGTFATLEAAEDAIRAALVPFPAEDCAEPDPTFERLCAALAAGETVGFYGAGEVKDVGEPRLTLRVEAGAFRLRDRTGEDHGAFGSLPVVWRYMAPLMAREAAGS